MAPATPNVSEEDIHYPENDGWPMAENDCRRRPPGYLNEASEVYYEDQKDVHASGSMDMY